MKSALVNSLRKCFFLLILISGSGQLFAQTNTTQQPGALNRIPKDTSKSNTNQWRDDAVKITFQKLNAAKTDIPDTSIHIFHRLPFTQPWYRDLGNLGSPVNNLLFTPESRVGPTLGYHVFDVYRYKADSLCYYNTSRPYSVFNYVLGSKLEQVASIMHTQNIRPNWNFAVEYRKINSPGFFKIERNNHDNAFLTTNYKSLNRNYMLYAGMAYNKEQHDENGGILNGSDLNNAKFGDRKTIDVAYQSAYSATRSSISNVQRDFTFILQHSYIIGKTDTTYNEDSTEFSYKLRPLFSFTHRMEIGTEKHIYKDLTPDSFRYVSFFNQSFVNNGSGYYALGGDSVITQQKWFWVDNKLLLNGFIGKEGHQLTFSAGLGSRYDQFMAQPVSNLVRDSLPKNVYVLGYERNSLVSNYLEGEIKKEALNAGGWQYGINTRFFLTGQDAGNFALSAAIGKNIKSISGSFVTGILQQLNTAPYAYTSYENAYTKLSYSFNKESVTALFAMVESRRLGLSAGIRNYVVNNYIYLNQAELPTQFAATFSVNQLWLQKSIKLGVFLWDNELVYQAIPDKAPVNIPELMGKSQFSYERAIFKRKLKIAAGLEIRYNSAYHPAGYDAVLNRFYYQQTLYEINIPDGAIFLNFKIKRFRAFIMADNMQQLIFRQNTILYTATPVINLNNVIPVYAAPDLVIRFGFSWPLVN